MIKLSLSLITSLSAFLPLLILILRRFNLKKNYTALAVYIILAALTEILLLTTDGNNLHFVNGFAVLSFILIGWLFYSLIERNFIQTSVVIFSILFFFLSVVNMFFLQGVNYVNSYTLMVQVIYVSLFSSLLIYDGYRKSEISQNLLKNPKLLTGLTFFFYYGSCFFVFAFAFEVMQVNSDFPIKIWNIHAIINLIFNCLLAYLVWILTVKRALHE